MTKRRNAVMMMQMGWLVKAGVRYAQMLLQQALDIDAACPADIAFMRPVAGFDFGMVSAIK